MTISEICAELETNLGLPKEALATWGERLASANVTSAGDLCTMNQDNFDKATGGILCSMQVQSLCICLGSAAFPHRFAGEVPGEEHENGKEDVEVKPEEKVSGGSKGGAKKETAEMLPERRCHMLPGDYYVPPQFDRFAKGIPGRDIKALRKLIVQEVLEVCGDLYPDLNERSVILGAIEEFCGPPWSGSSKHWDNWKDPETRKKHKGTAISDLEKARGAPEEYGVSRRSVPGRMRPVRLKRQSSVPPSAALVSGASVREDTLTGINNGDNDKSRDVASIGNFDLSIDDLDRELADDDQSIEDKVKEMQAALQELQEKKRAAAAAAKAQKSAAAEAAKAQKSAAAAAAKAAKAATADEENADSNPRKRKASPPGTTINKCSNKKQKSDPIDKTTYEVTRDKTVKANEEYLAFLERTAEANCKVLTEEEASALINFTNNSDK